MDKNVGGLSGEELEEQANELLKQAGEMGRSSGIYTETQLKRHCYREIVDSDLAFRCVPAAEAELTELVLSDLRKLGQIARLTEAQQDVWNLVILGLSIRDIAKAYKISIQAAHSRLTLARFKVIQAMVKYPYLGIWEVYYQLLRRGGRR